MCSELQNHLHPSIIIIMSKLTAQLTLKGLNVFSNLLKFTKYNEISILVFLYVGFLCIFFFFRNVHTFTT